MGRRIGIVGHATDVVKPVGGLYSRDEKGVTGFGYRICG